MAVQFLQTASDGTNQTNYTFASQNFGNATATRHIICTVTGRSTDGTSRSIVGVSIGGVSATENAQSENGTTGNVAGIFCAEVPTGTSGNVLVVFSDTMTCADIALYSANNLVSTNETDAGTSSTGTYDIDVVAGGFVVAVCKSNNPPATATWAGVTEDFDEQDGNGDDKSGGSASFTTTQTNLTVSCTFTATANTIYAAASFEVETASTIAPSVLDLTISVQAPASVTGKANATPTVIQLTSSIPTPAISIEVSDWTNQTKNTSTWINIDKS